MQKETWGRRALWLLPPAVTLALLSAVFSVYGLFPFGDSTISWCDMNQQTLPLLMDFKDILSGSASLFLNQQNAGGMNFWGVFLYYLSSPFSFLVLFVEKADFFRLANVLVALKMAVCSVTAFAFFRRRFPRLAAVQAVVLSVLYACSGYVLMYYQNIAWLDTVYLFPLFLLAVLRLAEQEKPAAYIAALTALLAVQFYLSYMVILFLILGSGIWLLTQKKEARGRQAVLLGVSTASAGLLSAPVWLPSLLEYMSSARTNDLLQNLRVGNLVSHLDTTLPVVFSTAAVAAALVLTLLYWRRASGSIRTAFALFVLLLLPLFVEPIHKMWHMGSYQAFPMRYGFITVFLGLVLYAFVLSGDNRLQESRFAHSPFPFFLALLAVALPFVASTVLLHFRFEDLSSYTSTLWGSSESLSLLFLFFLPAFLAWAVLGLFFREGLLPRRAVSVLLCVLLCVEVPFQMSVYMGSAASSADRQEAVFDLEGKVEEDTLFRVKNAEKDFDVNLLGAIGYPTLNHYTSLTSQSFLFGMKKLGYSSYWMEVNSNGGTALTDALLGNRYTVYRAADVPEGSEIAYRNGVYAMVKAGISLPFGFPVSSSAVSSLSNLSDEVVRMDLQQEIFASLFDSSEQLITEYEPEALVNLTVDHGEKWELTPQLENGRAYLQYRIDVKGEQTLYFDCFDELHNYLYEPINGSFHVFVNGELVEQEYPSQSSNGLVCLGSFEDESVLVQVELLRTCTARSFGAYGMDLNTLRTACESVQGEGLREENGQLLGSFQAEEGDWLFVPVCNTGGLSAEVNGKEAEVVSVLDCFFAVPLEAGENHVVISASAPGLAPGLLLGAAGLLCAVALVWFLRKKGYPRFFRFLERPALVLFTLLWAGVFFAVYLFPLILFFTR